MSAKMKATRAIPTLCGALLAAAAAGAQTTRLPHVPTRGPSRGALLLQGGVGKPGRG